MENDIIFEPVDLYNSQFKPKVPEVAAKYYEDLANSVNLDIEENRILVAKYKQLQNIYLSAKEKHNNSNIWGKVLAFISWAAFIIGLLFLIFGFIAEDGFNTVTIAVPSTLIPLGLIGVIVYYFVVKKIIKRNKLDAINKKSKADNQLKLCYESMSELNSSFEWNCAQEIFETITPLIQLDPIFDIKKFEYMKDKYGFSENDNHEQSSLFVLSGSINGNPFVIDRRLVHNLGTKTYTGTKTITWTEVVGSGENRHRVTRSEVLTAHVTKPCPYYHDKTILAYCNEAAPDLKFSRQPSGAKGEDEKGIERIIKSRAKDIENLAEKAVKKGHNFTPLANTDFEALFGATDRDNEVQFRLLFTPLAQTNMVKLIKSQEPYGDDFAFYKEGCINYICSGHSQEFDYTCDPKLFAHYSYDEGKELFTRYMEHYFQGLYFDLAPLMNIPIYQMHKSKETIYEREYHRNFTSYESEVIANNLDLRLTSPENCNTQAIIKTHLMSKNEGSDRVNVTSWGYQTFNRVDYEQVYGGDGRYHTVAVPWVEYVEVSKDSIVDITSFNATNKEMKSNDVLDKFYAYLNKFTENADYRFERGLLGIYICPKEE